ncbi:MAG TPA: hypothetical protein VMU01_05050 [Rhizomicrobium sp.]|nr:hypothetical protein [Rhizomicrobium sp.]
MLRTITFFSAALIGMLALSAQPAAATLLYDAHFCTPGATCNVNGPTSFPSSYSADDVRDFLQQAFADYGWNVDLSGAQVDLSNVQENWNGDVFGRVDINDFGIHTYFAVHNGAVVCCLIDEPYEIVDVNDNGLFIGNDVYDVSNQGQPLYPGFLAMSGGSLALPPVPYVLTPNARQLIDGYTEFVAIDDKNRILAEQFTVPDIYHGMKFEGWLELDPVVPEAPSALLVLPLLISGWLVRRRRIAMPR